MAAWKDAGQAVLILVSTTNSFEDLAKQFYYWSVPPILSMIPHDIVPYVRYFSGLDILLQNIYATRSIRTALLQVCHS